MSVFDSVAWAALAEQPVLEVGATVFAYLVAVRLFRRSGNPSSKLGDLSWARRLRWLIRAGAKQRAKGDRPESHYAIIVEIGRRRNVEPPGPT